MAAGVGDLEDRHALATPRGVEALLVRVAAAVDDVRGSAVLGRVEALVRAAGLDDARGAVDLVVLGVGPFATSAPARYQLALALLLRERLGIPPRPVPGGAGGVCERDVARVELFEPVLSPLEKEVLRAGLGVEVGEVDHEGRQEVRRYSQDGSAEGREAARGAEQVGGNPYRRTLFYMPHTPAKLYVNVLGANWDAQRLARTVVLGNSFRAYVDRWSPPVAVRPPVSDRARNFVLRCVPVLSEGRVTSSSTVQGAAASGRGVDLANEAMFADMLSLRSDLSLPPLKQADAEFGHAPSAFNDLSLHWFTSEKLNARPDTFWAIGGKCDTVVAAEDSDA